CAAAAAVPTQIVTIATSNKPKPLRTPLRDRVICPSSRWASLTTKDQRLPPGLALSFCLRAWFATSAVRSGSSSAAPVPGHRQRCCRRSCARRSHAMSHPVWGSFGAYVFASWHVVLVVSLPGNARLVQLVPRVNRPVEQIGVPCVEMFVAHH